MMPWRVISKIKAAHHRLPQRTGTGQRTTALPLRNLSAFPDSPTFWLSLIFHSKKLHVQGFIAATSWKLARKVSLPCARLRVGWH